MENRLETLKNKLLDIVKESNVLDRKEKNDIQLMLNLCESGYVAIVWTEAQDYMDEKWFDKESIFSAEDMTYLIPIKRVFKN
jgi:hypothetical protein